MRRSSSTPERGSALIEAVVIGSFVFIVIAVAVSAAIEVVLVGGEAAASARVAVVHAARHSDTEAASSMAARAGFTTSVERDGDVIEVAVTRHVDLPHPDGLITDVLVGRAAMPLAPFRSRHG